MVDTFPFQLCLELFNWFRHLKGSFHKKNYLSLAPIYLFIIVLQKDNSTLPRNRCNTTDSVSYIRLTKMKRALIQITYAWRILIKRTFWYISVLNEKITHHYSMMKNIMFYHFLRNFEQMKEFYISSNLCTTASTSIIIICQLY